jgi:hypothetical protein
MGRDRMIRFFCGNRELSSFGWQLELGFRKFFN